MAPTPTRDATSHTPAIHPEAFAIAHAFSEDDWDEIRAGIPAWHPRNDGDDAGNGDGGDGGNGDGGDAGAAGGQGGAGDDQLGDAGKKAIATERKARQASDKRAAELEAKLKQFEDKDKSDLERAAERATSAETRATTAEGRIARWEAARDAGLPLELADRLQGSTPEELAEDAERLKGLVKPAGDGGNGDGGSRDGGNAGSQGGSFDGGSRGGGKQKLTRERIAQMSEAEINANWAAVQEALSASK